MPSTSWIAALTPRERKTLYAGFGGFGVDAFDFMMYSFLMPTLIAAWGMSRREAGLITTSALVSSAIGGWLAGILADRYGRVRVLQWTIATFTLFTFLSGFTRSFGQLLAARVLQGFGFGGEWSVVTVLIGETIRAPEHRGKAVATVQSAWSVGWAAAAVLYWTFYALLDEAFAWRACFWVGILPALWIFYVRRHVSDPEVFVETRRAAQEGRISPHFWQIFSRRHRRTTLLGTTMCTGMLGGYYAITTWLPTYLKTVRGLSVFDTGAYLLVLIAGSFAGYVVGAIVSDRLGRRPAFIAFAIASFSLAMVYTMLPIDDTAMLLLGFPLGLVVQGIFAGIGATLTELYPNEIRGSGQGFCYNVGRGLGSVFPVLVGDLSQSTSLVKSIGVIAGGGYLLVIVSALLLPETRGKRISADVEVGG